MRVAFFTDTYHPAVDGVVRSIDVFGRGLSSHGHTVKIFAPAPAEKRAREAGVSYAPSIAFPAYPQYRIPVRTAGLLLDAKEFAPDIIHSHAMVGMGWAARDSAKQLGVPLIGTFHTLLPQATHYIMPLGEFRPFTGRRIWDYLRWFYEPFDEVIAPSRFMQNQLAEHGIGSTLLPTPVDTEKFSPAKPSARKNKKEKLKTILFVGRIAQEKNLDFLLEIAGTAEWSGWDAKMTIAGTGPYLKTLEKKIKQQHLDSSIRLLGRIPDTELVELYRSADAVIQPSKFETQGLTALESMACGTPVAVRRGTALAEMVEPGVEGELFGDDAGEAVEALKKIAEHRAHYGRAARKKALEYSIEKCTKKLIRIYEKNL